MTDIAHEELVEAIAAEMIAAAIRALKNEE